MSDPKIRSSTFFLFQHFFYLQNFILTQNNVNSFDALLHIYVSFRGIQLDALLHIYVIFLIYAILCFSVEARFFISKALPNFEIALVHCARVWCLVSFLKVCKGCLVS